MKIRETEVLLKKLLRDLLYEVIFQGLDDKKLLYKKNFLINLLTKNCLEVRAKAQMKKRR